MNSTDAGRDCVLLRRRASETAWPSHKLECKKPTEEVKVDVKDEARTDESQPGLDPLATADFAWTAYTASAHRQPRDKDNRAPLKMNIHSLPGASKSTNDYKSLLDPWPESLGRDKAHEKMLDTFRLWCDDAYVWKNRKYGIRTPR
ncbi:hypothetical protein JCM10212_003958 [Sporobolomyces blumeae]